MKKSKYHGKKELLRCKHACTKDKECHYPLKCFQRSKGEAIPGCSDPGGIPKDYDYCYEPNWNKASVRQFYGEIKSPVKTTKKPTKTTPKKPAKTTKKKPAKTTKKPTPKKPA